MSKLRRLGTYAQRVIGNRWSIVVTAATVTAAYWGRLVSALSQEDVHELTAAGPWPTNWTAGGAVLGSCLIGLLARRVYVLESEKEPMLTLEFDGTKDEFRRMGNLPTSVASPALY